MTDICEADRSENEVLREREAAGRSPSRPASILPGLGITFGLAGVAFAIRDVAGVAALSPLILAIVLGMIVKNVAGTPALAQPGITFSLKRILRFAIILLGLQLTVAQIVAIGGTGAVIVVVTLVATFLFTKTVGRLLGVDRRLAELIAAGTSVCGASAVIATNLVTRGSDEDVAYAVACVTVFGSLSMLLYPALQTLLVLDPTAYGLWTGSTIHEVAQVVAAAFQGGDAAGQFGTIAKLTRVALLAPLILSLGFLAREKVHGGDGTKAGRPPVPWFVFGFLALVLFNSAVAIPAALHDALVTLTAFLLSAALAAMGLETDVRKLRAKGLRPLLLGAAAWIFISCFGLSMVLAAGI